MVVLQVAEKTIQSGNLPALTAIHPVITAIHEVFYIFRLRFFSLDDQDL